MATPGLYIDTNTLQVGIGTTRPQQAFHVQGNILSTGTLTASNLSILGDFVTLNTVTSNTEQMVVTNAGTGPALKVTQTGANSIAEFYDDGNALALKIADGGNVGIGTANPQAKLHVQGNITSTGPIVAQDTSIFSTSSLNDTNAAIQTTNGPFLSIEAFNQANSVKRPININPYGGNVGIGTVNPQAKLHVNGTFFCPGMIIQAQYYINNNVPTAIGSTTTLTNYATGISVTIVPRFANSLIKLTLNCTFGITYLGKYYDRFLTRNGTTISVGAYGWGRQYGSASQVEHSSHSVFIDTPNSIASLQYAILLSGTGGHLAYNGSTVTFIAEEIAQ